MVLKGNFAGPRALRAVTAALIASAVLAGLAPAAQAEQKAGLAQAVSAKNAVLDSKVTINGVMANTVTGTGNTGRINVGISLRGVNLDNTRITTSTKVNGLLSNTVTGTGNTGSINTGVEYTN